MELTASWRRLPAFVALESLAVDRGVRRGASVQLDDSYFRGMAPVLRAADRGDLEERRAGLERSRKLFDDISVEINTVSRSTLREASAKLHGVFRELPEVEFLCSTYPGEAFVVPEWLHSRADGRLNWGARVYFFREGDPPVPTDLIDRNIDAVLDAEPAPFDIYHGELHGYPRCCVETFTERQEGDEPPEWRSVASLADRVREDRLGERSGSVRDLVPSVLEASRARAFFAREFFPEPDCASAVERGQAVADALAGPLPESLVDDYFRLNVAYCFAVADALTGEGDSRPAVGDLGVEHALLYLPLGRTLRRDRYR